MDAIRAGEFPGGSKEGSSAAGRRRLRMPRLRWLLARAADGDRESILQRGLWKSHRGESAVRKDRHLAPPFDDTCGLTAADPP